MPYFLFDEDFSEAVPVEVVNVKIESEIEIETFTLAELEDACRTATAATHNSLQAERVQDCFVKIEKVCSEISHLILDAKHDAANIAQCHSQEVAALLVDLVSATLPASFARHAVDQVIELCKRLSMFFLSEPQLFIYLHSSITNEVCAELKFLNGIHPGQINLIAKEEMAPSNATISWKNGIATHSTAAMINEIKVILGIAGLTNKPEKL